MAWPSAMRSRFHRLRSWSASSTSAPSGDVRAVDHVSLTLNAGEVVGLAGESGSGKSTLAYGACRLLRPPALITGGSIRDYGRRLDANAVPVRERLAGLPSTNSRRAKRIKQN